MNTKMFSMLNRLFAVLALAGLLIGLSGQAASAAPTGNDTHKTYYIQITGVEKNKQITVTGTGFPVGVDFRVRVGPFYDFHKNAVEVGTVNTGKSGNFTLNIILPEKVKDVKLVTVRLDSKQKQFSYNVFTNQNSGDIDDDPDAWLPKKPSSNPTPTRTPTPTQTPTALPTVVNACQIVTVDPGVTLAPRSDFDAVWTVKNTGNVAWNRAQTDYLYWDGDKTYKHAARYDMKETVDPGETVKIVVDMTAPGKSGEYETEWVIASGQGYVCALPLSIVVR